MKGVGGGVCVWGVWVGGVCVCVCVGCDYSLKRIRCCLFKKDYTQMMVYQYGFEFPIFIKCIVHST